MELLHDAGMAVIYRVERDEGQPPPVPTRLVERTRQPFGEMTVVVCGSTARRRRERQ